MQKKSDALFKRELSTITENLDESLASESEIISDEKAKENIQRKSSKRRIFSFLRCFFWLTRKPKKQQKEQPVSSQNERTKDESKKKASAVTASAGQTTLSCGGQSPRAGLECPLGASVYHRQWLELVLPELQTSSGEVDVGSGLSLVTAAWKKYGRSTSFDSEGPPWASQLPMKGWYQESIS
ncbi:uncharacterized protein ACOB8E_017799 [Sarcophilus harrisii]